jgi:AcrR family transcriptional regulator
MGKGAETRQAVIDEAARQASVVGLSGLTIGELAKSTGLSKSGLFGHFQSKEASQLAVREHGIHAFVQRVIVPALQRPRGEPRLRELVDRRLAWTEDPPWPGGCFVFASLADLDDQPGVLRDRLAGYQHDWNETVERIVQSGITEGHFSPDADPSQVAFELDGIFWSQNVQGRLLQQPALEPARAAFEALLDRIRA